MKAGKNRVSTYGNMLWISYGGVSRREIFLAFLSFYYFWTTFPLLLLSFVGSMNGSYHSKFSISGSIPLRKLHYAHNCVRADQVHSNSRKQHSRIALWRWDGRLGIHRTKFPFNFTFSLAALPFFALGWVCESFWEILKFALELLRSAISTVQ